MGLPISCPLMNEIWPCLASNRWVCDSMLFTVFALLLVWDALHRKSKPRVVYPIAAIPITIVVSGYESVTLVCVFLVFAVLLLQALYRQSGEDQTKNRCSHGAPQPVNPLTCSVRSSGDCVIHPFQFYCSSGIPAYSAQSRVSPHRLTYIPKTNIIWKILCAPSSFMNNVLPPIVRLNSRISIRNRTAAAFYTRLFRLP